MTEIERERLEAEIVSLKAQATKSLADAAKSDAERAAQRKTWKDWSLEAIKLFGAVILGAGGLMTAINGHQKAELEKKITELQIERGKQELDELTKKKVTTTAQLTAIKQEVDVLQKTLQAAQTNNQANNRTINEAIERASEIGNAISKTNASLQSTSQIVRPTSDYRVGIQTLGLDESVRLRLIKRLETLGYGIHDTSSSYALDERPTWFAQRPTVFYYENSSVAAARQLARALKDITGRDFAVQRGNGLGVEPSERGITFFVHHLEK